MESNEVSADDIVGMVHHWFRTPVNTYLGSDYGFDPELHVPLSDQADTLIEKLTRDLPILNSVSDSIQLFSIPVPPDKVNVFLQIGDVSIEVG